MVSERRAFGERLKRQRERQGITLQAISKTTKVAVSLFDGLERGDCSRWPSGLYARAYVRSYAEAIGLNANETVEEFASTFGETPTTHNKALAAATQVPVSSQLRLSIASDSPIDPRVVGRRAALAAADLVICFLIASVLYVGLGAGVWITLAGALAYHAVGRIISDEPLLYWLYLRVRTAPEPAAVEGEPQNVAVGDAASTTA